MARTTLAPVTMNAREVASGSPNMGITVSFLLYGTVSHDAHHDTAFPRGGVHPKTSS